MKELTFTRDDRQFLKGIGVKSDATPEQEMMEALIDLQSAVRFAPDTIIISQELARYISKNYGEVNICNYLAYLRDRRYGAKD